MKSLIIFVPVFNGAKFLSQSLASLEIQSYDDFDVYISNNFSSDSSLSIASEFVSRDSRFHLISPPVHFQRSEDHGNYLLGLTHLWSKYEYLAFRHDDDIYTQTMLEEQIEALGVFHSAALCFTGATIVDQNLNKLYTAISKQPVKSSFDSNSFLYSQSDLIRGGLQSCVTAFSPSVIIRTAAIISRPPSINSKVFGKAADLGLWCEIAEQGSVLIIPRSLFCYRKHSCSDSFLSDRLLLKNCFIDLVDFYISSMRFCPCFRDYVMIYRLICAEAIFRFCESKSLLVDVHFFARIKSFPGLKFYHFLFIPFSGLPGLRISYQFFIMYLVGALSVVSCLTCQRKKYILLLAESPVAIVKKLFKR